MAFLFALTLFQQSSGLWRFWLASFGQFPCEKTVTLPFFLLFLSGDIASARRPPLRGQSVITGITPGDGGGGRRRRRGRQ